MLIPFQKTLSLIDELLDNGLDFEVKHVPRHKLHITVNVPAESNPGTAERIFCKRDFTPYTIDLQSIPGRCVMTYIVER